MQKTKPPQGKARFPTKKCLQKDAGEIYYREPLFYPCLIRTASMKKSNESLISAVISAVSAVLLLGTCLSVVTAVPWTALPAWGVWVFGLSVVIGLGSMLCARNDGVLIGVVVPGLLLAVLALHWAATGGDVKRAIALAIASAGFWIFLWCGVRMPAMACRVNLGLGPGTSVFASSAVLLVLSKTLSMAIVRCGMRGVHATEIALAVWLVCLLLWPPSFGFVSSATSSLIFFR